MSGMIIDTVGVFSVQMALVISRRGRRHSIMLEACLVSVSDKVLMSDSTLSSLDTRVA